MGRVDHICTVGTIFCRELVSNRVLALREDVTSSTKTKREREGTPNKIVK